MLILPLTTITRGRIKVLVMNLTERFRQVYGAIMGGGALPQRELYINDCKTLGQPPSRKSRESHSGLE